MHHVRPTSLGDPSSVILELNRLTDSLISLSNAISTRKKNRSAAMTWLAKIPIDHHGPTPSVKTGIGSRVSPRGLEARPRQWRQWRQHRHELWFTQALIGPAQLIVARGLVAKGAPDLFFLAIAFRRSFPRDLLCLTPKGIGFRFLAAGEAWWVWLLLLLSRVVCLADAVRCWLGGGWWWIETITAVG